MFAGAGASSRSLLTRSPAQKPACKDLRRNGQDRAITTEAAYTPVSKRAGSRSL
ncbi:acetyltransferase [Lacticaseibacillus zeae]|uniref:Acetyltransferase n=1 Tax=Lacticaseibacillus zeae TaxID=57037 RepID=A0A5R8LLF4_LACZE|nr:acetyltransferase [Lacticaseibacillus zeae]